MGNNMEMGETLKNNPDMFAGQIVRIVNST